MKGGDGRRRRLGGSQATGNQSSLGRAVVVIALVVMAFTGLTAVPAAANHTVCDSGEFCIWENPNYGGDFWGADGSDPDWPCGWI